MHDLLPLNLARNNFAHGWQEIRKSKKLNSFLMIIPTLCEWSVMCDIIQVCGIICTLTAIIPLTKVMQNSIPFWQKIQAALHNCHNSNKALNMSGFETIIPTFTSEQEIFTK